MKFPFRHIIITTFIGVFLAPFGKAADKFLYVRQGASAQKLEREHKVEYRYYSSQSIYPNLLLNGYLYDVVSDKTFPTDLSAYQVIILPDIVCIDRSSLETIEKFLQQGGGVFLTGATGTYNCQGKLQGYDFLRKVLGSVPQKLHTDTEDIGALHFRYGYAGSMAVPPGYFLPISPVAKPLYLPDTRSVQEVAYWSEVFIGGKKPQTVSRNVGFVVRELPSGGRIAWVGADLEDIHNTPENRNFFVPIFQQLWNWLAGQPIVALEPWPNGKKSALLFHGDIESDFDQVLKILDPIKKYQVKTTFNLLMSQAEEYPEVVEQVRRTKGELGIHGYEHDHFWGQPLDFQIKRLEQALSACKFFQFRPLGLRPPYLSHDDNTIQAVRELKMIYITADRKTYANYPRVVYAEGDTTKKGGVVLFAKGELDDYDFFEVLQLNGTKEVVEAVLKDFERMKDLGGLYQFNYHSQYLTRNELIDAADSLLNRATSDKTVWIATAAEIADWVLQRDGLDIEYQFKNGTLYGTVVNNGLDLLATPYLKIVSPSKKKLAHSQSSTKSKQNVVLENGYIKLPKLKKGETFSFEISSF